MNRYRSGSLTIIACALVMIFAMFGDAFAATPQGYDSVVFTSAVQDRTPVDVVQVASDKVVAFTELNGVAGKTVIHRWEYLGTDGKAAPVNKLDVAFHPTTDRYRTWSDKNLYDEGVWAVSVLVDGKQVAYGTVRSRHR